MLRYNSFKARQYRLHSFHMTYVERCQKWDYSYHFVLAFSGVGGQDRLWVVAPEEEVSIVWTRA